MCNLAPLQRCLPRQTVILRIGQHARGGGQTVGVVVHGRDLGDVPDVLTWKPGRFLGVSVPPVSHEKVANCTRLHNVAAIPGDLSHIENKRF